VKKKDDKIIEGNPDKIKLLQTYGNLQETLTTRAPIGIYLKS